MLRLLLSCFHVHKISFFIPLHCLVCFRPEVSLFLYFLIHSSILYLLIKALSPLTFRVVIQNCVVTDIYIFYYMVFLCPFLLFIFPLISWFFFFPLFSGIVPMFLVFVNLSMFLICRYHDICLSWHQICPLA